MPAKTPVTPVTLKPASLTRTLTQTPDDSGYWQSLAWFLVLLLGVLAASGGAVWLRTRQFSTADPAPASQPAQGNVPAAIAPLTGLAVAEETVDQRPWAVVIENFPSARPQAGLASADIVFEAPTEGGITRHLAIFQSESPSRLGPVRSARPYFNELAQGFGALYSHSGGSAEALEQLRAGMGALTDVNEFFNERAYERDAGKKAPHNLFTSAERFMGYAESKGWPITSTVPKLTFTQTLPPGPEVLQVDVPYMPSDYGVRYEYSEARNGYLRLVDGTTLSDAGTNEQILTTNVVLMYTDVIPVPNDPLLKVNIRTTGTGDAIVFTGGRAYRGVWSHQDANTPPEFLDLTGYPLPFQPGKTWVSILDHTAFADIPELSPELTP